MRTSIISANFQRLSKGLKSFRFHKKFLKKVSQQMYFILPARHKTGLIFPAKYPCITTILQNSSLGAPTYTGMFDLLTCVSCLLASDEGWTYTGLKNQTFELMLSLDSGNYSFSAAI